MKTWKPTAAGTLSIIAGALGLLISLVAARRGELTSRLLFHMGLEIIAILGIIFGIIAIVGGIFAIRRQVWGLALAWKL